MRLRKPKKGPEPSLARKLLTGREISVGYNRFDGRYLVIGLIMFTLAFGMILWWVQNRAFYDETHADSVDIAGNLYPVTGWRGIDATSSPLKLRACFLIEDTILAPPAQNAVPLVAPRWFKCFKAQYIAEELADGTATAYLAEYNNPDGFDRIIAVSSSGRAYMWRQSNGKYGQ